MNDINKMLCQDKFGILLTFNDGDQQVEGIYDIYLQNFHIFLNFFFKLVYFLRIQVIIII